jgi:hypothetical protein
LIAGDCRRPDEEVPLVMVDPIDTPEVVARRRRRRGLIALLLSACLLTLGSGALSLAIFTDTDASTGSFAVGSIDINTNPAVLFTATGMMPGDTVNATLAVSNDGSAQLRYAMSTTDDGDPLADQLTATIKDEGTDCATFDGATLYSGALSGAAIGDASQGADAGDRTLNAAAAENLCFRVTLPGSTDDTFQGASTDVTFTFDAEQTANNP